MHANITRARLTACEVGVFLREISQFSRKYAYSPLWGATYVHCPFIVIFERLQYTFWLITNHYAFECSSLYTQSTHSLYFVYTLCIPCVCLACTINKTNTQLTFVKTSWLCPSPASITLTGAISVSIKTISSVTGVVSLCAIISVVCDSSICRVCQLRTVSCIWIYEWWMMIFIILFSLHEQVYVTQNLAIWKVSCCILS